MPPPSARAFPDVSSPEITHHRLPASRLLSSSWWRERARRRAIDRVCRGYSTERHWSFFRRLLARPQIGSCLVLGVYYGRDIAYMSAMLAELQRHAQIVGVDKFEDSPCADWPAEHRGATWEQAGFGPAPDLDHARANLARLGFDGGVSLHQGLAKTYLASTDRTFDFIYIDISHDYDTTRHTIDLAVARLKPSGLIGGDDFSDEGTWGVARAVRDRFSRFELFSGWIWLAQKEHYRAAAPR